MILTRSRLAEIGRALYGEHWRAPMAERLSRTKRTIERYADGSRSMPKHMAEDLERLIDEQIELLNAVIGRRNATKIDRRAQKSA